MRLFMCFGGSAAVVDGDGDAADGGGIEAAVVTARHRRHQRGSSFRGKFLSGSRKDNAKKPSAAAATSPPAGLKKREVDADAYGLIPAPASSSALSSAASLDSSPSSASSSSRSSASAMASSSVPSSSPSVSGALFPPPAAAKRQASKAGSTSTTSPAAGAAAVALCLLMVVFCGRLGATVLTSTALFLFPRRWPARSAREEDGVGSPQCDDEAEEETPAKRKVVTVTVTERGSW